MCTVVYIASICFDATATPSSGSLDQNFLKTFSNKTGQNKHTYICCTLSLYGIMSQKRLMSAFNYAANCLLPTSQCDNIHHQNRFKTTFVTAVSTVHRPRDDNS